MTLVYKDKHLVLTLSVQNFEFPPYQGYDWDLAFVQKQAESGRIQLHRARQITNASLTFN